MAKSFKKIFVCSKCDTQFPKWQGRCTECGNWGTIAEQTIIPKKETAAAVAETVSLGDIKSERVTRFKTGIAEFDRVLGKGLASSSVILLGGDPGIGKSTLVLQTAARLSKDKKVIYLSGEESPEQVKQRGERLNLPVNNLQFLIETDVDIVSATLEEKRPDIAVVDSIQTLTAQEVSSPAGSIQQIKVSTTKLLEVAKKQNLTIIIIGHVTKGGAVAGPRTLEHLVDAVLYLEGDRYQNFRILRAIKNRFGSTGEIGVFEMKEAGLKEVRNPSRAFLRERSVKTAGSVVTCILEGSRPLLIEVQALVTKTGFGYPQRKSAGFDDKRLQLLLAVLSQRAGVRLLDQDIHINVVGGVKIKEPAADLAVCLSIISARKNVPLDSRLAALGEVGLGGEIRPVLQIEKRLEEAYKLGFKEIIMPLGSWDKKEVTLHKVKDIKEAVAAAFKK